ncbi:HBL103Cp [Eremothecium sinecaudum]|uniref:HBL103Cp n=1 Tax=Eremothecium sinecaudum TaxID=45286 RepID=A0A120K0X7_9SACH|nr:HBL103Cp [Eremothecium sinecaudum]AMD18799.1 HBL103Cp [Eremothecium sinecaudum]
MNYAPLGRVEHVGSDHHSKNRIRKSRKNSDSTVRYGEHNLFELSNLFDFGHCVSSSCAKATSHKPDCSRCGFKCDWENEGCNNEECATEKRRSLAEIEKRGDSSNLEVLCVDNNKAGEIERWTDEIENEFTFNMMPETPSVSKRTSRLLLLHDLIFGDFYDD